MPGANCAIYGCGACRSRKYKGLSIIKVPSAVDDFTKKWRSDILNVITRDRVVDPPLKKQIEEDQVYVCEQHFLPEELYHYELKKTLKEGSIPHLKLPKKTLEVKKINERSDVSIKKRADSQPGTQDCSAQTCYKNYEESIKRIKDLKIDIEITETPEACCITMKNSHFMAPKYAITVDFTLNFFIRVYGWLLPPNVDPMKQFDSSFQNVTLSYLLKELDTHVLCNGINLHSVVRKSDGKTRIHCIPKHFNLFEKETVMQDEYLRSNDCHLLIKCEGSCSECKEAEKKECKLIKQKESAINTPAKLKAPLSKQSPRE
eukprot:gene11564-12759_t